ncbi:hypothetical protein E2C01_035214 [Portunus trituberculatus]|uniref:Uncharacterized protein n=1 Tax=Portunus trituberculatus TaxID=210409 RepID=A0A5B7F961_PORTR|nr:hypothetical protein [Portunus trituberculatus]
MQLVSSPAPASRPSSPACPSLPHTYSCVESTASSDEGTGGGERCPPLTPTAIHHCTPLHSTPRTPPTPDSTLAPSTPRTPRTLLPPLSIRAIATTFLTLYSLSCYIVIAIFTPPPTRRPTRLSPSLTRMHASLSHSRRPFSLMPLLQTFTSLTSLFHPHLSVPPTPHPYTPPFPSTHASSGHSSLYHHLTVTHTSRSLTSHGSVSALLGRQLKYYLPAVGACLRYIILSLRRFSARPAVSCVIANAAEGYTDTRRAVKENR